MTLREACHYGKERLKEAGVPDAEWDARLLLEYAGGFTRSHYYAYPEEQLNGEAEQRFREALKMRCRRVPLQYITGTQEFMGYTFCVNEHVLIPRQDTELLAEEALAFLKPGMSFLDLCTGSGCILLSILSKCPGVTGVGADISVEALRTAKRNRERLGCPAMLLESDLFENIEGLFDLIVSNPPYIRRGEIAGLMAEVRDYEPLSALDGHEDGLYFYRRIAEESRSHLKAGGGLYLEIGYDQGTEVTQILKEQGFVRLEIKKDLAGLNRVVKGIYPG